MIGLTDSSVPIAAWVPLIRPPFFRYSSVSSVEVDAHVVGPRLERLGDLGGGPALGGELDGHPGEDPLGHRRALRVDDVDLAIGQHVAGDLRALDRSRQGARDVDRHDRLGAGLEGRLVGVLEVAGRRGGRLRERRVGRDHPLPERLGREVDAGLERLRSRRSQGAGTIVIPSASAWAGSKSDAESVKIATRLTVGSSWRLGPGRCGHDTGRVQPAAGTR